MIYQLSSPLQADLERATVTPPAGTQEQPLQWDLLSARGCSLHENMEAGPKMLWRGVGLFLWGGTRCQTVVFFIVKGWCNAAPAK